MRLNLIEPSGALLVEPSTYNKLFTLHGLIMIFFFPGTLHSRGPGEFPHSSDDRARDLAFPRLNLLSWYIFMLAELSSFIPTISGGVDTGWTFYTPLSTTYCKFQCHVGSDGSLYIWLFLDFNGPELHRDHPQNASSGTDLVSFCHYFCGPYMRPASSSSLPCRSSPSRWFCSCSKRFLACGDL